MRGKVVPEIAGKATAVRAVQLSLLGQAAKEKEMTTLVDKQRIEFVTTKIDWEKAYLPDIYQLRPDRKWILLQKFALWILRKLGCFAITENQMMTRHTLVAKDLMEAILKQNSELMSLYHHKGERLLIGHEEFRELTGIAMTQPHSFLLEYGWGDQGGVTKICGMPVTIVPWMSGMLVLPKNI